MKSLAAYTRQYRPQRTYHRTQARCDARHDVLAITPSLGALQGEARPSPTGVQFFFFV